MTETAAAKPARRTVNVVSPHRDDAALSLARTLCEFVSLGLLVNIVSCFTRTDWAPHLRGVEAASAARKKEDQTFVRLLDESATLLSLELPDAPLRSDWASEHGRLREPDPAVSDRYTAILRNMLVDLGGDNVAWGIPLALNHRDHSITRAAAAAAAGTSPLFLYEEIPYALTVTADQLAQRVEEAQQLTGYRLRRGTLAQDFGMQLWLRAAACYPSQFTPEEFRSMASGIESRGGEAIWTTASFDSFLLAPLDGELTPCDKRG